MIGRSARAVTGGVSTPTSYLVSREHLKTSQHPLSIKNDISPLEVDGQFRLFNQSVSHSQSVP